MDKRSNDKILKRLLGPADPELLCDGCFEKLDQYVELEFRGREADARIPGMRAHLEGCPACHEDYESLRDFVQSVDLTTRSSRARHHGVKATVGLRCMAAGKGVR